MRRPYSSMMLTYCARHSVRQSPRYPTTILVSDGVGNDESASPFDVCFLIPSTVAQLELRASAAQHMAVLVGR